MVDLRPAHLDYGQRLIRHIGSLAVTRSGRPHAWRRRCSLSLGPRSLLRWARQDRGPRRLGFRLGAGAIRLALFVVVAGTAGVLVAGLLLPVVGGLGLTARSAADSFDNLPEALRQPVLAQQSRDPRLRRLGPRDVLHPEPDHGPLTQISPKLQKALVAIEDERFYEHKGIDVKGLLRAYVTNQQAGETKQGGSTITQQYVKQVLLLTATRPTLSARRPPPTTTAASCARPSSPSASRSAGPRSRSSQAYLNIVFFGDRAYGAEAASESYFGVHASQLTLAQAATLAGLVQQPGRLNPLVFPSGAQDRRDTVLDKMLEQKLISQAAHDRAVATPMAKELHPKAVTERLLDLVRAVLLRLRHPDHPQRPDVRGHGCRPAGAARPRRPDDPDHARPADPEHRRRRR